PVGEGYVVFANGGWRNAAVERAPIDRLQRIREEQLGHVLVATVEDVNAGRSPSLQLLDDLVGHLWHRRADRTVELRVEAKVGIKRLLELADCSAFVEIAGAQDQVELTFRPGPVDELLHGWAARRSRGRSGRGATRRGLPGAGGARLGICRRGGARG